MNQMKIGSFLKELRKENELTQEQLAEKKSFVSVPVSFSYSITPVQSQEIKGIF